MSNPVNQAGLIWNSAEILRGSWKRHEFQDVILPLVVLKRLDSVLKPTKSKVLDSYDTYHGKIDDLAPILNAAAGVSFYNTSPFTFELLLEEPSQIAKNFRTYLAGYSQNIQDIFAKFEYDKQLERLEGGNLLYLIIKEFNKVDLHPDAVDNHQMGSIFEHLLQKFSELSNETAGEHYSPRDVIKTAVEILFEPDKESLKQEHLIKTIYDCACGTGGMLTVGKDHIVDQINPTAEIYLYGQELNPATYAICKSDMLIKGEHPEFIKGGEKDHAQASTLSNDQFFGEQFDYLLTNPPFGVEWKKDKEKVESEERRGFAGRFGAGTPRISDGQLLFLQHLISKMRNPSDGGSRLGIVFNGSPLFTGDAGSGESEIRRWIIEHDWLETIVALPDQLFYNTGIYSYLWFLSNRKDDRRKGKVQLIDARKMFGKMRKSLGQKRHEITDANRAKILELYKKFEESEHSKIFKTMDFGYRQITIERPLRRNYQVTPERIEILKVSTAFQKLAESKLTNPEKKAAEIETGRQLQVAIVDQLLPKLGNNQYKSRDAFAKALQTAADQTSIKLAPPLIKTITESLSEHDDTAEPTFDKHGKPEPDSDLRDTENVPLGEDINAYFEREVKPYVPDAWINESIRDHKDNQIGKVGYEIPLTRYFYKYQPPRSLEAIENDIEQVENELLALLKDL